MHGATVKMTNVTDLKCHHSTCKRDIKEQGITNTEGEWGCQNRGFFLYNCVGFFIGHSVVA
jgi:hypothetical protein